MTGELIYNNASIEPIKLDHEIAHIAFFGQQSKYWMAIGCWDGKVAFLTRPQELQGRRYLNWRMCTSSHSRDVISVDIGPESQIVTASNDNTVCFWNSFSA